MSVETILYAIAGVLLLLGFAIFAYGTLRINGDKMATGTTILLVGFAVGTVTYAVDHYLI